MIVNNFEPPTISASAPGNHTRNTSAAAMAASASVTTKWMAAAMKRSRQLIAMCTSGSGYRVASLRNPAPEWPGDEQDQQCEDRNGDVLAHQDAQHDREILPSRGAVVADHERDVDTRDQPAQPGPQAQTVRLGHDEDAREPETEHLPVVARVHHRNHHAVHQNHDLDDDRPVAVGVRARVAQAF